MKLAPFLLLILLAPQESPEKSLERMKNCLNEGKFVEGRNVARAIIQKYPGTAAANAARPFTEDNAFLTMEAAENRGPMANRVDLTIMADGAEYDDGAQKSWTKESESIIKSLFKSEVLKEYEPYFNIFRAHVASKEARLNKPDKPTVTFFKSREDDGEIASDRAAARDVAALSGSRDRVVLLQVRAAGAEHGISKVGVAVVGSVRPQAPVVLHAFGHAFAGLADEGTSLNRWGGFERNKKEPGPVPVAANVSDARDLECLPWAHWIKAKTEGDKRASKVDIFEGAALRASKAWRPVDETLCVMNAGTNFCPVCREMIVQVIYTFVRPIDEGLPFAAPIVVEQGGAAELWVRPMKTATRRLAVGWIVEKAADEDRAGFDAEGKSGDEGVIKKRLRCPDGMPGQRRGEGPTWKLPAGEMRESDPRKDPEDPRETFSVGGGKLPPGRWRVTAVVRDMTEWVLRDSQNLLVDWRRWVVEVK